MLCSKGNEIFPREQDTAGLPNPAIFTNFSVHVVLAVAWSSSGRVTKSQGEGAVLGFSTPLTMHCNAFAASNVMQQKGSFRRCRWAGMTGVHSAGEVWSTIALLYTCGGFPSADNEKIRHDASLLYCFMPFVQCGYLYCLWYVIFLLFYFNDK